MPNPEESFTKIDVPADGSCLFWAVTLAYLTPVKNDDALFRQRYETLFGNEETAIQNLNHVRNLVQNYNIDDTFAGLVRSTFRSRVVDHIRSRENEFKAFVEGESGRSFDDYLQNMRDPNTLGGEPEIRAMSEMLQADISVSGASDARYTNGDIQIQLFHVGTSGVRNHYNFGLERHIIDDNEVDRLQNSLKESIKHYQTGPQDFELVQLLIQEADSLKASTSIQQRKDFEARFQSYIDQISSYLHSVKKPGFFPHFFLGSFSTLLDTEIAGKLDIGKIYFDFDGAKTLKVAVIKNGEINSQKDVVDKVKLFVISESGSRPYTQEFDQGELQEVLGEHYSLVENNLGEIKVKFVEINKDNINDQGISVTVEDKKVDTDHTSERQFTEIKKGLWGNSEGDIAKLVNSNVQKVEESLGKILNRISTIHSRYESSLEYASRAREAAHHGFIAGALNNFRYRHNLRVYLEQFGGRGYTDIVLLVRGTDRALNSVPIIIELKAGRGPSLTPDKALEQAEKYAQGFQPNVQRVLTTSGDILCVGVNLDYSSPISNIEAKNREGRVTPFFQDMLESVDDWYREGAEEVDKRELKEQIKDNLERIYHTFPGTPEKGDNHYFSRFLLGQSLLLSEALGAKFEKHIFIYDRDENIPTEIHPESGRPQRPAAQQAKGKLSTGLDASHAVVSMVLIPESTEKLVCVINIVEADRKVGVLSKGVPLDRLSQKIGDRKIVELNLNFNIKYRSDFKKYFSIKVNKPISLRRYDRKENRADKFQGVFRNVPYPNELKETFDQALDSQRTSAQSSSIDEYNQLFKKIGEGIWPFKTLIGKENDFQGVLNGAFSYYSDLKLQESPETRALVLTEFQTGRGERVDMLVHGIKFEGDAKEYTPIGLELKASRQGKGAKALLKKAEYQINEEYKEGVTYKTLTDGDKVEFIGVVFNKGAKDADSLILTSEKSIPVKAVHSSIMNIAERKRLEEAQEIIQRSDIRDTLKTATKRGDYHYWLSDHDIRGIANVEYSNLYDVHTFSDGYENSARGLAVISDQHLDSNIAQFKDIFHDDSDAISLRTFIINLGNNHWVTLVVSHQNGQYNGYYADSQGNSIPDDVRQVLEQAQITVHDVSVAQQTDIHNCGLWALENARDINAVLQDRSSGILDEIYNRLQVQRDENHFVRMREDVSRKLDEDPQRKANLKNILAETHQPVGQCSKERKKRSIGMTCVDSRDEEDITKEEKERRIKELLSDEMIMKIKLKELESEINDEVLSRHEEIESVAAYDVNKSDVLSNALQSLKLSKMLLLMSQKSEVSTELQEKAYYNALIDIGALIHDHKNHVHGDHLSALESRVHGNQLFSVAHDLYYLSKSEGNVEQDKLYSDQVKSKISSYMEGKNRLDDIYSEFSDIDIKGFFSDNDVKDFYAEAEAYDKEVITIHSTQVFADEAEVYVKVIDNNKNHQKVVIGDIASIQNTENYILDEETSEIKLRVDGDKEYTIIQELEEEHIKHYLNIPGGHKVKVGNIISSFTEDIKEAIHSKLDRLELLASKKDIEEISNAEVTDQDYSDVLDEIKQSLLQKGVSEGTFNQLKDHLDNLGEKVFAEYISDVEKNLEGHGIEFDRNKFNSAKVKGAKSGKFFFFMAIYDLFDSISDVPTLGRHDNDALKKIFGINGILDAMDDVRESLSASYIRSDGKVITKISRDSVIGKVVSKIPDHVRKTFVKIINNPVVQSITFATIAYQFGYSMNEIVKGNHHPLNYYWTASSGIKLVSMSIKPISIGVSFATRGISATTKVLRGLSAASKVLGKAAVVTMVADVLITIGVKFYERIEYTKAIARHVPLLLGNEQAEVFFAEVIKAFTGRDIEEEYEDKIRVKGYLSHIKEVAIKLLNDNYNMAAVVQYVTIKEEYSEIIRSVRIYLPVPPLVPELVEPRCETEYNYTGMSVGEINSEIRDLSFLDISKVQGLRPYILNGTEVCLVNQSAKHLPHITLDEYSNGLRVVRMPLTFDKNSPTCSDVINKRVKSERPKECNDGKVYRDCRRTFTLSGEPFIFTNVTRSSSCYILYLSGPNRLTAAENSPAVMFVPEGGVDYKGSKYHNNAFIINYDTHGHLIGGTESDNTVVMNYNTSTISVVLRQYGYISIGGSGIGLLNVHNYISHSTANQNITTDCKTRYVNVGRGGGNNVIWNDSIDCQDEDYEIRKVNKKDTHLRSKKRTTFIIDKSSGSNASIISSNNLESKKNLDIIFVKNIDIAQLKINEHQDDYSLELLADDKRSTVASTKIDSFKNLVIQVDHYEIEKTIIVQDKSLPDIIKDIEYQKLNHSGSGVGSEITENSKKRSKAMILAEIKGSWDITPYEVAKNIINNSILGIPIYLARAEKVIGNVTHEGIVEGMYPGEVVADFSHGSINCKEVITIEVKSYESKCVVKFPQAHECDHLVNFTLRINNRLPYASASYKIIDLTECNINPADVECIKSSEDDIGIGVILNGYVNQRSFHIVLDNYLLSPQYQRIALQFNKGGEFYKINSASLKLEPILYNYEKKVEADYDSFVYYKPPNEQELQILRVYHNQPNDKNKIGFIDLKDKSIFDSNMEIIDGSLMLLHNNTTFMEIKNWNTNRPTRKMVFAFNEAVASDLECLFSTCDPEGIVEEFRKEIKKLINKKDKYGYTQLHYAAREGNLNLVTFLLDSGADINAVETSIEGKKPIHVAAMEGHKNVIEFFLSKGMSVNDVATGNGWTPLHYAAWQGHLEAARLLVDRGADINAVEISAEGKKPIHVAAEGNNKNIIEFLLSKGVSVNDTDKEGWTPLHWAARNDCLEAARFLVDRGADINAESNGGTTPLEMAETWSGSEIVNFLKAKKQSEYDYRLLAAVKSGNVSEVTDLLNRGANIEAKDEEGWTPLHWAAWIGHLEIASFLVDRRANISAADTSFNGGKPIHVAARGNNKNIIEFLLSKGVSVNDTDKEGWTPLHWAAWSGSLEAARFLVDRGANINAEDSRGTTPLEMAETWSGAEMVNFLRAKQNEKSVQRKRRHYDLSSHKLFNNQPKIAAKQNASNYDIGEATSGASKQSSWINDLFGWVKDSVGGLLSSRVALPRTQSLPKESTSNSKSKVTTLKADLSRVDVNSTILLLDTFIRKFTGQKYISTAEQPTISLPEAECYASDIVNGFEKVLKETAIKSGISITNLNFDPMKLQSDIVGQLINGKFSKISKALYSSAKQVCPDFKQNKKFLSRLETRIEEFLDKKEKEFSSIGPKRKEAKQIHKRELCNSPNFITNNPTTLSLANTSRSESQLPGKTDDKPRTCLNDPTVDKHLQRSL